MKRSVLPITLLAVLSVVATGTAAPKAAFKAKLVADTHTPKVNTTWHYHVRVTDAKGHPIPATITSQIVDPIGGKHLVEFDGTGRNPYVKGYKFFGNFCDSVIWPTSSAVGVTLKFETVIVTKNGRTVLIYPVTPHS
jgi:hypothetical protein